MSEQQVVSAPSLEWACWLLSFLFEVEADITSNSSLCVHNLGVFNALVRYLRSSGSPFKQRVVAMLVRHLQEPQKFPEAPPLYKLRTLGQLVMKMAVVQVKKKEQLSSGLLGLVELHIATVRSCRMFKPSGKTPHLFDEPIPVSSEFQQRLRTRRESLGDDSGGEFDLEDSFVDESTSVSESPSSSISQSGSQVLGAQHDEDYSYEGESGSLITASESDDDNAAEEVPNLADYTTQNFWAEDSSESLSVDGEGAHMATAAPVAEDLFPVPEDLFDTFESGYADDPEHEDHGVDAGTDAGDLATGPSTADVADDANPSVTASTDNDLPAGIVAMPDVEAELRADAAAVAQRSTSEADANPASEVIDSATAVADDSRDLSEVTATSPGENAPIDSASPDGVDAAEISAASELDATNIATGADEPQDMPSSLDVRDTEGFKVDLPESDLDKVRIVVYIETLNWSIGLTRAIMQHLFVFSLNFLRFPLAPIGQTLFATTVLSTFAYHRST